MTRTTVDTDVFRAVADASRRTLLDALATGPKSFGELNERLALTKGAVSQHLSILASVRLVTVDDTDRSRRYSLTPAPLRDVDEWLAGYRAFWDEHLDRLGSALTTRRAGRVEGPT